MGPWKLTKNSLGLHATKREKFACTPSPPDSSFSCMNLHIPLPTQANLINNLSEDLAGCILRQAGYWHANSGLDIIDNPPGQVRSCRQAVKI